VNLQAPSYELSIVYWFDEAAATWRAQVIWSENRQGKQYGPAFVQELCSKRFKGRSGYSRFMAYVRRHIAKEMNTYWT